MSILFAQSEQVPGSGIAAFLPFLLIGLIFYFLILRPQSKQKKDHDVYIIVECKQPTRKDGIKQLKKYLTFCDAYLGVWFNGKERLFLQKYEKQGKVLFKEIPNIPKFGENISDIGLYKRKDLA